VRIAAAFAVCAVLIAPASASDGSVVWQRQPGFFEISGPDLTWVHDVHSRAGEVLSGFAGLIDLPARYPTPVFVRVRMVELAVGEGGFRFGIEPAGIVTLTISPGPGTTDVAVRHALARALLLRHAAWMGGFSPDLKVPAWLEEAGVAASLVAAQSSMDEGFGREAVRHGPLPLAIILSGGSVEALPGWQANSWILAQFLRTELGGDAWHAFLRDSLRGGTDPGVALSRTLGRGGANPEIAWAAGFFNLAARHSGPGQSAQQSYRTVTRAARFIFRSDRQDTVFPWERLWFWRESDLVRREADARSRLLLSQVTTAHPFFVNAFASLQDALQALLAGDGEAFGPAFVNYEDDLAEAVDLALKAGEVLEAEPPPHRES